MASYEGVEVAQAFRAYSRLPDTDMATPKTVRLLGVYAVRPTSREFEIARFVLYGEDLTADELPAANRAVEQHYSEVYLIEIEVDPADADIDWLAFTQPVDGKDRGDWQVPWDERSLGNGRWVFFLHSIQFNRALQTPCGDVALPSPTSTPARRASIRYELPG